MSATLEDEAPHRHAGADATDVGILAMEVYFPATYVAQSDLEKFTGVPAGKYTLGLGQTAMSFTGDREDVNSLALTCVSQLLAKYEVAPTEIGRLDVGTESLVDKSKSTKTALMRLFAPHGNSSLEGVTNVNACYGGTAALFQAVDWVQSAAWDGRLALVVAVDVAVYAPGVARPTGGAGAVAMLVGPHAPLALDSRTRTAHAADVWDFYKPDPSVEFPTVDGALSTTCYMQALDACYHGFCAKNERDQRQQDMKQADTDNGHAAAIATTPFKLSALDFTVFHSPYNKLVVKAFARLSFLDYRRHVDMSTPDRSVNPEQVPASSEAPEVPDGSGLQAWRDVPLTQTYEDRALDLAARRQSAVAYARMAVPCHWASQQVGNCYTASLYLNLATLVCTHHAELTARRQRIAMFSYGSGSVASMFALHTRAQDTEAHHRFSLARMAQHLNLSARLAQRTRCSAAEFTHYLSLRGRQHGQRGVTPLQPVTSLRAGTYYLEAIDDRFRRRYAIYDGEKPEMETQARAQTQAEVTATIMATNEEHELRTQQLQQPRTNGVYVTGVSAVLPGSDASRQRGEPALQALLRGDNCIEPLSDDAVAAMLARNLVCRSRPQSTTPSTGAPVTTTATATAATAAAPHRVETRADSIQVAAITRPVDLCGPEYALPSSMVAGMDESTRLAVAAGLDALKQAGLVHGREGDWHLHDHEAETTGVIYATSYPSMNAALAEAERFYTSTSAASADAPQEATYALDRKYLFRVLVLANAQLAQLTGARGPNTQVNAACASMTQAVGMAHDWLALRRCSRVLVVASDVASSEAMLPWIGGGFRVLGAASTAPTPETAALPFDARRNGMLVGSGAAAMVLQAGHTLVASPQDLWPSREEDPRSSSSPRSSRSRVRLVATRFVNSAFHGAAIDVAHVTQQLLALFLQLEVDEGITRDQFVAHGVYYSHETFTNSSPTASCAYAEIEALRNALGFAQGTHGHADEEDKDTEGRALVQSLLIANTKGFTGHPMGVSFEDVVAVEALRSGVVPGVAHFQQHDPNLGHQPLRLAQGGPHAHRYALRFAAGFGSQAAFTFYALDDEMDGGAAGQAR